MSQKLDTSKIIQVKFPDNQFYKEVHTKNQVVIHHTVSGANPTNVINAWTTNAERVATAFVIGGDGTIAQAFSSKYWAHHLGLKKPNNTILNQQSIGIEVCNWGGITEKEGKFYTAYNKEIAQEHLIDYGKTWRGYRYFHRYTAAQIESLRQLLVYLCDTYKISKEYHPTMWDIDTEALKGKNGVFTHVTYRADKSDMHPQPELIEMLKGLSMSS
jgi:N-acetyl-anhydromuramyl-L-alanine amidase AmpD